MEVPSHPFNSAACKGKALLIKHCKGAFLSLFYSPRIFLFLLHLFLYFLMPEGKACASPALMTPHSADRITTGEFRQILNFSPEPQGTPSIFVDSQMGLFEAVVGSSHKQYYFVDGFYFTPGQIIRVEVVDLSGSFTISKSSDAGFGSILEITAGPDGSFSQMIYVKYEPAATGGHSATIAHSGDGALAQTLLVDGNATSLPVEFSSFQGEIREGAVALDWVTAMEKNNSHFEIEISKDPLKGFRKIGRVNSKVENSKRPTAYRFVYQSGPLSGTYYFRLKQVDTDDAFMFSEIIAVEGFTGNAIQLFPNPLCSSSKLYISLAEAVKPELLLSDMGGKEVYRKSIPLEKGEHKVALPFYETLPAGIYLLTLKHQGSLHRIRLVKE